MQSNYSDYNHVFNREKRVQGRPLDIKMVSDPRDEQIIRRYRNQNRH